MSGYFTSRCCTNDEIPGFVLKYYLRQGIKKIGSSVMLDDARPFHISTAGPALSSFLFQAHLEFIPCSFYFVGGGGRHELCKVYCKSASINTCVVRDRSTNTFSTLPSVHSHKNQRRG